MRQLLLIFILYSFQTINYCQTGLGVIHINGYYNTNNKLSSNIQLDKVKITLIELKTGDTLIAGEVVSSYRKSVPPGDYKLIASFQEYENIIVEKISIASERIRFTDLLFEPQKKYRKKFTTGLDKKK